MLRLATLFLFSFFIVWAKQPYDQCLKVLSNASITQQGQRFFATKQGLLGFNLSYIEGNYTRYDPLTGLYLYAAKDASYPLKVLNRYPKEVALYKAGTYTTNTIIEEARGLEQFAKLKTAGAHDAVVMGHCCTLRGFNTPYGVITARYIDHFLTQKAPAWATAGIDTVPVKNGVKVVVANPFFPTMPFKRGDTIVRYEGKKLTPHRFADAIAFETVGTKKTFGIVRNGKEKNVTVTLSTRLGGGVLSETYLEHYGMRFDKALRIHSLVPASKAIESGLMQGDRLCTIDGVEVATDREVRTYLSGKTFGEKIELVFEREGLQFFVYLPSDIMHLL